MYPAVAHPDPGVRLPPSPLRSTARDCHVPSFAVAFAFAFAFLSVFPGHAATARESTPPKPLVLTTFLPVFSLTAAIAGDRASVENWLPSGVDPHDFQFSPRDLRRLRDARILVTAGLGLEGWTEAKLRGLSGNPNLRVVEAAHGLPAESLIAGASRHRHDHDHDHDHDHAHAQPEAPNPHFWLDPVLMTHAVTNIRHALELAIPDAAETFHRNAESTLASLRQLDADFRATLSTASTAFITYHDAFPYLAKRYGLRLAGVVESGPSDQPSARQLSELGALVRRENVKVLFMDGDPPRLARRLASDFRLKLLRLETLETGNLTADSYQAGMRRNLQTLRSALSGEAKP